MSLNGLDAVPVLEAYQSALAEAGGWFLLKYTSRDAVDVLARGSGGAADARAAIASYEEQSPLYGFLLYRRRKLLIKYVPDGTSRLLQARVAVHFSAVMEKFTPHDTEISISSADHLSDAALTSACSLHTAAPSSSSSSSSSQMHKLDDITEDAEEGQSTAGESVSTAKPTAAVRSLIDMGESASGTASSKPALADGQHGKAAADNSTQPSETSPEELSVPAHSDEDAGPKTAPIGTSFDQYDLLFEGGPDPRLSSQTARPALSDLYAEIYAQYNKPKVKLGPRPKASMDTKRPHTSGAGAQSSARPISSLPSGLRAANRKAAEPKQAAPRDATNASAVGNSMPPPIPAVPDIPVSLGYAPKSSAASVKSLPMNTYSSHNHKSHGVTPEKQRLMKALELRKKQMQARKEKQDSKPEDSVEHADDNAQSNVNAAETLGPDRSIVEPLGEEEVKPNALDDENSVASDQQREDNVPSNQHGPVSQDTSPTDSTKPLVSEGASAMEAIGKQTETEDLHSAASISSPTSAQTAGSSGAPSTRPSSVSEDDQHPAENGLKLVSEEKVQQVDEKSRADEGTSTESTPTVVPDHSIAIPSVEVASAEEEQEEPGTKEQSTSEDQKELEVSMASHQPDEDGSSRVSKRESVLFMPRPDEQPPTRTKKQNRESMMLAAPSGFDFKEAPDKRRVGETLHISAENSEAEYLSDDSFMEELQSAKLEEAMPMSVSKSPITPFFTQRSASSNGSIPTRSASQIVTTGNPPAEPVPRKSSGPWLPHANSDTVVMAKKINVSSGISQRIKALAEKSNRDSTASISSLGTPDSSSSIVAQRKSSFFATTPPSGNSPNGRPISRLYPTALGTRSASPSRSPSPSPDVKVKTQPNPVSREQNHLTVHNAQPEPEKSDSVQVTARIVRDPRAQNPPLTMPTENTPLDLRQSDITIDHHKSMRPPSRKQSPVKAEPTSPVRPPSSREASSSVPRSSSEISWRAFGRRMSESKQGAPSARSRSAHSIDSSDEKQDKQEKKEKKESRASKLFKRMSTIPSSMSRKNSIASSTLSEEEGGSAPTLPSLREPPSPVQVGDLNIQFPDTLLWKRRWVEIDVSGNLVLSLSKTNDQSKGITRRFHLTEFCTPYPPDQDRQELPNSVVFDFVDGRTLQCACETPSAQAHVLHILREAHEAWHKYTQGQ